MASRITLKSYFQTLDKPTQAQFIELIDSMAHLDDFNSTLELATLGEALAGSDNVKAMSPFLVRQAFLASLINDLTTGGVDKALTANQGVIINNRINNLEALLAADPDIIINNIYDIAEAFSGIPEGPMMLITLFNQKVDKEIGKGLSQEDFTSILKLKLDTLHAVAISGEFNALINKPSFVNNGQFTVGGSSSTYYPVLFKKTDNNSFSIEYISAQYAKITINANSDSSGFGGYSNSILEVLNIDKANLKFVGGVDITPAIDVVVVYLRGDNVYSYNGATLINGNVGGGAISYLGYTFSTAAFGSPSYGLKEGKFINKNGYLNADSKAINGDDSSLFHDDKLVHTDWNTPFCVVAGRVQGGSPSWFSYVTGRVVAPTLNRLGVGHYQIDHNLGSDNAVVATPESTGGMFIPFFIVVEVTTNYAIVKTFDAASMLLADCNFNFNITSK